MNILVKRNHFFFLSTFLSFLFFNFALAGVGDWKTFTSTKDVREVAVSDSLIWCATNGGVLRFSTNDSTFKVFTNTEGLTSNDAVAIEMANDGRIWVGLGDGRLNIYDPVTDTWHGKYLDENDPSLRILDIKAIGDSLLVALNVGIALYEIGPGHVKETYKQLGWGRPHFIPVNQILVEDSDIWAATNSGIAHSSLKISNLQAPKNWTNYTTDDGLPSNEVNALFLYDSTVVAGTNAGVSFFYEGWSSNELTERSVFAFCEYSKQIVAGTNGGVFVRNEGGSWQRLGPWMKNITDLGVDTNGNLWVARLDGGLSVYKPDTNEWIQYVPDGPGGNGFRDVTLDKNGVLWCASAEGLFRYNGHSWQNFNKDNSPCPSNDFRCVMVDHQNRVWAGTWGDGITAIEDHGDSLSFDIMDEEDGLSGAAGNPSYVVVNRISLDSKGNIWILNSEADNHNPVAVVSPDGQWQYFSTTDGIKATDLSAIEVDRSDRVWIGSHHSGIQVIDHNNTLFDKSDDDLSQDLTKTDGLESSSIRAIAEDHDGILWIGTSEGLNYWFEGEVNSWYGLISDDINTIAVDARNNKWIGTSGGLSVLSADGYTLTHYTTENSPLASNDVQAFTFNNRTGEVYIATANGLSLLETPFSEPEANLAKVRGYPNPFIISGDRSRFFVESLADESLVNFFTLEGALVRHIPSNNIFGSRTEWDGRNDKGELVASGIYIFVVSTESGMSAVGKVAVIRY